MEQETGIILNSSPTQKVQGFILEGLNEVKHSKPMLSAQKTKDINEVQKFVNNQKFYASYKLDGLTLVVTYENGELKQAVTRGDGERGEDVTEQAKMITNLPMKIPYKSTLELRGECIISWSNFRKINETLETPYSHPRNLAAGSIRTLDTNVTKQRNLEFVVFECITDLGSDSKWDTLQMVSECGFTIDDMSTGTVENLTEGMQPEFFKYPVDGLIFELDSIRYSKSLGSTGHHENCRIALKWADETYETILRDVEWNTTRTGLINPVAIFDEVNLGGALTTRATLHNISIIEKLELGIGDTITIYRANMVIPKVDDNLTRSNTLKIPTVCPVCGAYTEIKQDNDAKVLICTNNSCGGMLLSKFVHFTSKKAMDIEGLSEATLEKFINLGWLKTFPDIYRLNEYQEQIENLDGFGKKSYVNLWSAIEKSKNTTFDRFICSLGIPNIGRTASKTISKRFNGNWFEFNDAGQRGFDFTELEDFGETMNKAIRSYFNNLTNYNICTALVDILNFEKPSGNDINVGSKINGLTFVITGSVEHYKNRDELKQEIESRRGKVSGSVSAKTDYLINNDVTSTSGKNKKANELGIKIISENDFLEMIK